MFYSPLIDKDLRSGLGDNGLSGGVNISNPYTIHALYDALASGNDLQFTFNSSTGFYAVTYNNAEINVNDPNDNRGQAGIIAMGHGAANQGGYWSNLDWKGIGDATIGMLGGAGEIATASATEVGSEGLSTAVSVPLAIDGWGRVGTNFNRLAAYFGGNKALGDALPSNIGGYVGKTVDIFSGVDLYSTGNGQAILGGTNDLLLMISPWGNAGAWKSVLETPNL